MYTSEMETGQMFDPSGQDLTQPFPVFECFEAIGHIYIYLDKNI